MNGTRLKQTFGIHLPSAKFKATNSINGLSPKKPGNGNNSPLSFDLFHFISNENGQQYILNGRQTQFALESKYSSKFCGGKFRFVLPEEIGSYFPDTWSFRLETLDLRPTDPLHGQRGRRHSGGKSFLRDYSQYDYPYVCQFGGVRVLAKEKQEDVRTKVLEYVTECCGSIRKLVVSSIELIGNELKAQGISLLVESGASRNLVATNRMIANRNSRNFNGGMFHEEYILRIDKFIVDVYNGEVLESANTSWVRHAVDCLGNGGVKTLAAVIVKRLISFCKVLFG